MVAARLALVSVFDAKPQQGENTSSLFFFRNLNLLDGRVGFLDIL